VTNEPLVSSALLRSLDELRVELAGYGAEFYTATNDVSRVKPANTAIAHQAQWHMRGAIFHATAILDSYSLFARGVSARAQIDPAPDVLIMYAPALQEVFFSFYALVNLARITLDNLRLYLRPVFRTDFRQLPKSVSGFLEGETDCPVYVDLENQPVVSYLSDLRNCLVHFRSFAVGDNAVVVGDHVGEEEEVRLLCGVAWFDHMARARFRRTEQGVSVNVFLPDKTFDRSGAGEKLAQFTYKERINLVSQSIEFTRLVRRALLGSFALLLEPGTPTYQFRKQPANSRPRL
jgi:hypothetical protein